jgi:phytoene/squalene synthetase
MKDIYGAILRAIEKNKSDVFSVRAHVTTREKLMLLLGILVKGEWVSRPIDPGKVGTRGR